MTTPTSPDTRTHPNIIRKYNAAGSCYLLAQGVAYGFAGGRTHHVTPFEPASLHSSFEGSHAYPDVHSGRGLTFTQEEIDISNGKVAIGYKQYFERTTAEGTNIVLYDGKMYPFFGIPKDIEEKMREGSKYAEWSLKEVTERNDGEPLFTQEEIDASRGIYSGQTVQTGQVSVQDPNRCMVQFFRMGT